MAFACFRLSFRLGAPLEGAAQLFKINPADAQLCRAVFQRLKIPLNLEFVAARAVYRNLKCLFGGDGVSVQLFQELRKSFLCCLCQIPHPNSIVPIICLIIQPPLKCLLGD